MAINAGTVLFADGAALGPAGGSAVTLGDLNSGADATLLASASSTVLNDIAVQDVGAATVPIIPGTRTIGAMAGVNAVYHGAVTMNLTNALSKDAVFYAGPGGTVTFDGGVGGTGAVTLAGGGVVKYTGAASYNGPTSVSGADLVVSGAGAITASSLTLTNGHSLGLDYTASNTSKYSSASALTVTDGSVLLSGNATGAVSESAGALGFGAATLKLIDAGKPVALTASSFVRAAGGTLTYLAGTGSTSLFVTRRLRRSVG